MGDSKRKTESNVLVQGSILAAASLISRVIGLLYNFPLTNIIGNKGNDYYSTAYEIYNILLLISSYSLPRRYQAGVSQDIKGAGGGTRTKY